MLPIVRGKPVLLPLRRALQVFVDHRRDVVTRRTLFDLREGPGAPRDRRGPRPGGDQHDRVIEIIRSSKDTDEAKGRLIDEPMARLGGFLERAGRPAEEVAAANARQLTRLSRARPRRSSTCAWAG